MPRLASAVGYFLRALIVFVLPIAAWSQQTSLHTTPTQNSTTAQAPGTAQSVPEITSHEETSTFKVKVNLVEVRVVVRDARGKAIGNLQQEDFQLFDSGKPQAITRFTAESAQGKTTTPEASKAATSSAGDVAQPSPPSAAPVPKTFVAYLFDDVHMKLGDLA